MEIAREEKVRVRACVWNGKELGLQGEGKEADTDEGLESEKEGNVLYWILEEAREGGRGAPRRIILEMPRGSF